MSLENEIVSLAAAVKELTEALRASASPVTSTTATLTYTKEDQQAAAAVVEQLKPTTPPPPAPAPKVEQPATPAEQPALTREQVKDMARKFMRSKGEPAFKALLADFGAATLTAVADTRLAEFAKKLEV